MKKVFITGANKGIGFETARQLATHGYFVFIGSRNKTNGENAINKLHEMGLTNVDMITIDVADAVSIRNAAAILLEKSPVLDILINNAAIVGEQPQTASKYPVEKLQQLFNTNYFGTIRVTQALLPLLEKSVAPHIINIASEVGSLAMNTGTGRNPNWDLFNAYGSTKTAVNAFTVTLFNELRDSKFRVNSVTPGYTATDLNEFKGFKTVEEGAAPIVRLAMNDDLRITGKFFREEGEVSW